MTQQTQIKRNRTFGALLRETRKTLDLTQADIATRIGLMDDRTYRRWETGEHDIPSRMIAAIAQALDVTLTFTPDGEVTIQNQQITKIQATSTEYRDYNPKAKRKACLARVQQRRALELKRLNRATYFLTQAGFQRIQSERSMEQDESRLMAYEYEPNETVAVVWRAKDAKAPHRFCYQRSDEPTSSYFDLTQLLEDIRRGHGQAVAQRCEKSICFRSQQYRQVVPLHVWLTTSKNEAEWLERFPELASHASVVCEQVNSQDYFRLWPQQWDVETVARYDWFEDLKLTPVIKLPTWQPVWEDATGRVVERNEYNQSPDIIRALTSKDDLLGDAMLKYRAENRDEQRGRTDGVVCV